jgi:glutamine synthetase
MVNLIQMSDKQQPKFLRVLFTTSLGTSKCIETSYDRFEDIMENGILFDGSSVQGYATVNASDLLLRPTSSKPVILPWNPSVSMLMFSINEVDDTPHPCDVRYILTKAINAAADEGFMVKSGCELEFFLVKSNGGSIEPGDNGGYFSTQPSDGGVDFRRYVIQTLNQMGIETTAHHHEVARGQHELGLRYGDMLEIADNTVIARLVIAELAYQHDLIATFMPKPFWDMNGSGMHMHQSLWDLEGKKNLGATGRPGEVTKIVRHYVAGILKHAKALSAIVAPTVNSYKRLVPGFEAPTRVAWGPRNRSTMIRIPHYNGSKTKARVEFRSPDPSCSPHLAFAAILTAGLDGIKKGLEPPEITREDLFEGESQIDSLPGSLIQALAELDKSKVLRNGLGNKLVDTIIKIRTAEWNDYVASLNGLDDSKITAWELDQYLMAN